MKLRIKSSRLPYLLFIIAVLFFISGCANTEDIQPCLDGRTYGLLHGLLHGILAPVDLIAMLFRDDVSVFAVNNNGFGYALGFLIGSGGWGILGGKSL